MPRPTLHPPDAILDAARSVVLRTGARSATVEAIAEESGAPVGSLYHRFASRDELLARLWIRAAQRSQRALIAAARRERDALEAAVGAAVALCDFAISNPEDARLLVSIRLSDLLAGEPSLAIAEELHELNRPLGEIYGELARRLYGSARSAPRRRVDYACGDLPIATITRRLRRGERLTAGDREMLETAVRAVLEAGFESRAAASEGGRRRGGAPTEEA